MTEREAIKYIEGHAFIDDAVKDMCIKALDFQKTVIEKTGCDRDKVYIAIMRKDGTYEINGVNVLEAIEKQIPKPVVFDGNEWTCPHCDTSVLDVNIRWCDICGQKLDWENEEKYKLALFGVVRNNFILPVGIEQGRSEKEISQMTIATIESMMEKVIDFDRMKECYELGVEE